MDTAIIQTLIGCIFGGGLIGLIEFLIKRHDEKQDKNSEVLKAILSLDTKIGTLEGAIGTLENKGDERNAVSMRVRILRFRDEMLMGQNHTHDSFQQVLSDIDEYENFCNENPTFRNNQTVATIEHIKHNYQERLEKHDFL